MLRIAIAISLVALGGIAAGYAHWTSKSVFAPTAREASGDPFVGRDGRKEAQAALSRGKLIVLEYGLYLPWDEERREFARSNFGIEYRLLGGCVVTEPLVQFTAAYNQMMQPAIIARFGADVFEVVDREGKALHEQHQTKKEANQPPEPMPLKRHGSS